MSASNDERPVIPWHLGVFDAHCHPTDTINSLKSIPNMKARALTIMATRAQDQMLVADAAREYGVTQQDVLSDVKASWSTDRKVVPAFGWHPWFSHQIFDEAEYAGSSSLNEEQKVKHYETVLTPRPMDRDFLLSLPDPRPLSPFLSQTKAYLLQHHLALIGEVGLDRSFRIPETWLPERLENRDDALTPGGREGRKLSPYRVSIDHQRKVLLAQLRLAGVMRRAVSVHGVAAHGIVYETIAETWNGHEKRSPSKRERRKAAAEAKAISVPPAEQFETESPAGPEPYPPRLCLHSFSGPAETVKQYVAPSVPCKVFFSFSATINAWSEDGFGKTEAAVRIVPDDRLLIESDLHQAGEEMDHYLEKAVRRICRVKGWDLDDGIRILGRNWLKFISG